MNDRPRIFVMNDPHAMRINPYLADEIGFQESVVFLQLEYLIRTTKDPSRVVFRESRWWYRATLKELSEEQFSWWSKTTIHRVLHRLEERSLISTDETNAAEYDRTQWYAIDEEGVRNLASIAIFQNEMCISHSETGSFQSETGSFHSETTIQGELVVDIKETLPNGRAKKVEPSSPEAPRPDVSSPPPEESSSSSESKKTSSPKPSPKRISAPSPDEAERRFRELCERSRHGEALATLAEIMAEDNATGKVQASRVWREIGARYLANRKRYQDVSEDAWAYGFEAAITKGAANVGYVTAAARGYRPEAVGGRGSGGKPQGRSRQSIAVIGATEDDYREEDYRFHV